MNQTLKMDHPHLIPSQEREQGASLRLTGIPVQKGLEGKVRSGPPRRGIQLPYASHKLEQKSSPAVIQRKQIVPLRQRLLEFDADVTAKLPALNDLIVKYDGLPNTKETKEAQETLLDNMLTLLAPQRDAPMKRAFRVVLDELSFVQRQSFDREFQARMDPWKYMAKAPFFQSLQKIAEAQGILPPPPTKAEESQSILPPQPTKAEESQSVPPPPPMEAGALIAALSQHHIDNLGSQLKGLKTVDVYKTVLDLLQNESELVHYTHFKDITVIHSTDYLKQNAVLHSDEQDQNPGETTFTTKNQEIDFRAIQNTGFVFMFLERKGDVRSNTRFGNYRTSLPVASPAAGPLLDSGWAIMHDLANAPSGSRAIYQGSPISRVSFTLSEGTLGNSAETLSRSSLQQFTFFTPNTEKRIIPRLLVKQTPHKIEDQVSGNFLMGRQILPGIALRVECELSLLQQVAPAEAAQVIGSKDKLWEYIKNVIYNMQIMVPSSVMPEEIRKIK